MTEIKDSKLKALQARAERAQSHFETHERMLYRNDGQPVYGEAEMNERLRALRSERTAELRQVQEEVREIGEAAAAEISNVESRDPAELLTAEEIATAGARRLFAQDAAASLDTEALVARLRSVLAGGDKGAIFAHLSAGEGRRGQIIERRRDRAEQAGGTPAARASVSTFTPLDEVLSEMREVLDGGRSQGVIEAARSRQQEAVSVEMLAANLTVGARSASEAHFMRNYANSLEDLQARSRGAVR